MSVRPLLRDENKPELIKPGLVWCIVYMNEKARVKYARDYLCPTKSTNSMFNSSYIDEFNVQFFLLSSFAPCTLYFAQNVNSKWFQFQSLEICWAQTRTVVT